ncbi:unnamed protein product [Prunus armeniaca]
MQALPNLVVVGKDSESMVTEIGPLLHLQGTFCLSRLENVMDAEDARQANLNVTEGLHALLLEWSDTAEKESDVLKMLKPHRNLKELMIKENCSNCRFLPTLGQLPSPKMLYLRRMSGVESVWVSLLEREACLFRNWRPLSLRICNIGRNGILVKEIKELDPYLKTVSINRCPRLEVKLPENLDSLTNLMVHDCDQLVKELLAANMTSSWQSEDINAIPDISSQISFTDKYKKNTDKQVPKFEIISGAGGGSRGFFVFSSLFDARVLNT